MQPRQVRLLGVVQCVYWGVLFYAFPVLLRPLGAALGHGDAAIAGAFSLGLAASAMSAIAVGRAFDRGHGIHLMRVGALLVPLLLLAWARVESLAGLYAVWTLLGLGMGMTLYEPAFALVIRSLADAQRRLRALATVTLLGGLASSVFVPLTAAAVERCGWRATLVLLALPWLAASWVLERGVLRGRPDELPVGDGPRRITAPPAAGAVALAVPFVAATFAAIALVTLLIPLLLQRGQPLAQAAWVLALLGLGQLPGRLLLARAGPRPAPATLLVLPLLLQVAGLLLLGLVDGLVAAGLGVAVFGVGAGLYTVARPWAVAGLFGEAAATVNGRIAAAQTAARAAAPVLAMTAVAWIDGARAVLVLGVGLLLLAPLAGRLAAAMARGP